MNYGINHSSSGSLSGHYPKASTHISSQHHQGFCKIHHKSSSIAHHGGHYKAPSVHGSTKISSSHHRDQSVVHGGHSHGSLTKISGDHRGWKNSGLLSFNEKETMQHLNQRLSSYLDNVHSLKQENAQLERKICEWYADNAPRTLPDSSQNSRIIKELQNEVSSATLQNARIVLQIDNAQSAADDLQNKYEMEHSVRNNVEADIAGLHRALEELNMQMQELETQVHCLQVELLQLKKRHEEEVNALQSQLGARVNVELNAAPSVDLNRALSEIREKYENLMERNLREVENIFLTRSTELNHTVSYGAEELETFSNETIDLKHSVQILEIELQSERSLKSALECNLAETESTFASQLAQLQGLINNIEAQLTQIRSDLERQNSEYQSLMDQKMHLEMEIATYKHLLDGHDVKLSSHHISWNKDVSHHSMNC